MNFMSKSEKQEETKKSCCCHKTNLISKNSQVNRLFSNFAAEATFNCSQNRISNGEFILQVICTHWAAGLGLCKYWCIYRGGGLLLVGIV